MNPTVSIVLATYNRLALLRLTIASLLAQTLTDWELVIADDGSDEATRRYLRTLVTDARIRVLWLEHCGTPAVVRNAALAQARGQYVAFADSDDLWLPEKLALQVAAMCAAPGSRWSYTAYDCIDEHGERLPFQAQPQVGDLFESLLRIEAVVALPTVLAERSLLEEVGGFDPEQEQAEDIDLWLRLVLRADVVGLGSVLTRARFHHDHYCRGGVWNLYWLRYMYEKAEALVTDDARRRLVRSARTQNAVRLMRAHAAVHDWRAVAAVVRATWNFSWRVSSWWRGLSTASVRLLMPDQCLRTARRVAPGRPHER